MMRTADWRYWRFSIKTRVRHLFGLHTMIGLEEWDLDAGSMRYVGMVCWGCGRRI